MYAVSSKADIFRTGGILFLQPSNNCQNYIHICVYASEKIGVHHFSNFIGEKKIYIYIRIYVNFTSEIYGPGFWPSWEQ